MHLVRWDLDLVTLLCLMSTLELQSWASEVTVYPGNTTVIRGQKITYTCMVSGDEPSFIKWFHNDTKLSNKGAKANYHIHKKNRTLHFREVHVVNRGSYYCRAGYGSSAVNSTKVWLTVHAPAEIISTSPKSGSLEVSAGSVTTISCHFAGIPPPVVEWRRHGNLILKNQSNAEEVQKNTSAVSVVSSLNIIASQSAIYTCRAFNSPLGILFNASANISITVIPTAADATTPPLPDTGVCAPYNGTTCKNYLHGRLVLHNATEPIEQRDAALEAQLQALVDLGLFSAIMDGHLCEDPARRLLCHMTFPDCHNETRQALPICQESCEAVKSVFCFRHLAVLEGMKTEGNLSGDLGLLSLPDCPTLPSKWNSSVLCVESDHHGFSPSLVRDDCYLEKGRWYNGTVSSTKSGLTCQAWVDSAPQKHDRSPLIFPELIGAENFCRNPAGEEGRPWCYTTDAQHRWEECDIEMCGTYDRDDDDDMKLVYIIGSCGLVMVCFSIGILVFLVRHCHHTRNTASRKEDVEVSVENLPLNSAYHQMKSNRLNPKLETLEFPRNDIVFIEDIGQGAFGRVFKARLVCSGGNCHIRGGKMSDSKHSLSSGKNCKHKNIFSKGDIRPLDTSPYSKYYDSKLLGEHLSMLSEHNKDFIYKDCDLVAVKMLKEDASETIQADFEREASLMVEFDHVNIVRLLGVCTLGRPMCLLFEYMSKGDLNEFLRLCSPDQCLRRGNTESNPSLQDTSSITIQDQLHMARQIACGMLYLSERGYVHRDLATRNCLIGDNLIVKISDFGLARSVHSMDYYHGSDKDAIPVRWMPPEAILYNKFSTQSDVWSFGVLLWEIFSFAIQPYYGMTHEEVVDYLRAGKVLPAPDYGPSSVYELMKSCWHRKPLSRPTFVALHKSLNVIYEEISKLKLMNMVNL